MYSYEYPRPAYSVDVVVFDDNPFLSEDAQVLLIKRKNDPYKDCWALPGGFVDSNEMSIDAAIRELREETGLQINDNLLQRLSVYDKPNRDPRGWTISQSFTTCLFLNQLDQLQAGDDAAELAWFSIKKLPSLAFDHHEMIGEAINWWWDCI